MYLDVELRELSRSIMGLAQIQVSRSSDRAFYRAPMPYTSTQSPKEGKGISFVLRGADAIPFLP